MSAPWAILWFIVTLTFLIFIHELGHYLTARWRGVKVLEFGIGLPPRIWGKQRGETIYSINWVPLGGFCKMLGEEDPSEPGSLAGKSAGTRLIVLSAGSLVMLLFPLIAFPLLYMIPQDVIIDWEGLRIEEVAEDSPAYFAGVQVGDQIISLAGEEVDTVSDMHRVTSESAGQEVVLIVTRDDEPVEMSLIPRTKSEIPFGEGSLGVVIDMDFATPIKERESYLPWKAVWEGADLYGGMLGAMKDGIIAAFREEVPLDVGGVVAGGQITTEIAERGDWRDLMFWGGLLSFNLGIVNLLPLPALDGGRIIFVLLEVARRGKRVSPEKEGRIHLAGFFMLIAFILFVTYQDIARVVRGESLLP